ncbi:MAG: metal-dependent phosphohydrolase [Actinomycetota bacterium]|nr:metal-dependent phosphohydrolase [Actinomycetota bacterium]
MTATAVDLAAWTALVGDTRGSADCWARMIGRWSEPHRRYHAVAHLAAVLLFVDEHADQATDPAAVRLAAWYHDAVYDPRAADNEERSAALAETELAALGLPRDRVREVARLIRLTASHDPAEGDRNGELLNDADLMVLASPPEAYVAYLNAIRQEYAHVTDRDFRTGRAAVLDALLAAPRLYRLEALAPAEAAARANLRAELSLLRSGSAGAGEPDAAQADADQPGEGPPAPPDR